MKYDLTNVAGAFINHEYDESVRADLVRDMGVAVRTPSNSVRLLIAQVAHECLEQPGNTPITTIQIGIMYGLVLGVLCEQDRLARENRIIQ